MKKYFYIFLLLISPFIVYFVSVEYFCRTKTAFAIKKNYFINHLDQIKILILGSSHTADGLHTRELKNSTFNLSNYAQPLSIDFYLYKKYINKMSKIDTLILDVSPHRFFNDLYNSEFNKSIYSIAYNINYKCNKVSLTNYSYICSNFDYFSNIFRNYIDPSKYKEVIDKYGGIYYNFEDKFLKHKYNLKLLDTIYHGNADFYNNYFELNIKFMHNIINICKKNDVKLILISTPLYYTYFNKIPQIKYSKVNKYLEKLKIEYNIPYYNYIDDKRFNVYDFKDEHHLNNKGAHKFRLIIGKTFDI